MATTPSRTCSVAINSPLPFSVGDSISKLGVLKLGSPKTLLPFLGETGPDAGTASWPSEAVYTHWESPAELSRVRSKAKATLFLPIGTQTCIDMEPQRCLMRLRRAQPSTHDFLGASLARLRHMVDTRHILTPRVVPRMSLWAQRRNEPPRCVCLMFNNRVRESPGFVSFFNFCGVSTPNMTDFKLTT